MEKEKKANFAICFEYVSGKQFNFAAAQMITPSPYTPINQSINQFVASPGSISPVHLALPPRPLSAYI